MASMEVLPGVAGRVQVQSEVADVEVEAKEEAALVGVGTAAGEVEEGGLEEGQGEEREAEAVVGSVEAVVNALVY